MDAHLRRYSAFRNAQKRRQTTLKRPYSSAGIGQFTVHVHVRRIKAFEGEMFSDFLQLTTNGPMRDDAEVFMGDSCKQLSCATKTI